MPSEFFSSAKKMSNALQGREIRLSELELSIYEEVIYENALRDRHLDHDRVIIHDRGRVGWAGGFRGIAQTD